MQHLVLTTDDIPERDRFSYWREHVNETLIGVTGERAPDDQASFAGRVAGCIGTSLAHFRYRSDRFPVFRRPREIARRGWEDWVWLYHETGEGAWFNHGGQEYTTRRGDLIVADPTVPFKTEALRDYDIELWFFPRALLEPHLPGARLPQSTLLSDRDGINGLALGYLDALGSQVAALSDAQTTIVADNFCRLLGVALGGVSGDQRQAIRAARLEEAKRYIDLNLSNPELTPERAAAALRISVRQLHVLFEPTGTSFARYVLRRRLEECRTSLTGPAGPNRSVTDIALGWGFNSLGTFYRTFRQAFGMPPSAMRGTVHSPK
jgi:AraC-like DNA-binding protein